MVRNYTLQDVEVSLLGGSVCANVMVQASEETTKQDFYRLALKEIEDILEIEGIVSPEVSMRDIEIAATDTITSDQLMEMLEGYHIACK